MAKSLAGGGSAREIVQRGVGSCKQYRSKILIKNATINSPDQMS
jgi:hypothetical protein